MEEHEEERDFHALGGEAVGVSCAIAFEEPVGSHLTQVIAQLVETVALGRQAEVDQEGLVEWAGTQTPTTVPACNNTSMSRIIRVSWILMPGYFVVPTVIGRASRCRRGSRRGHSSTAPGRRRSGR